MSNTWTSANTKTFNKTLKLEQNNIYQITDVKSIKTKY